MDHINQSTGTHLVLRNHNDCAKLLPPKTGKLVLVSHPERGLGIRLDWYQSSLQHTDDELTTSSNKIIDSIFGLEILVQMIILLLSFTVQKGEVVQV